MLIQRGPFPALRVTSRGSDRYMMGQRSPFARDKEDLWKLIPEKSGPLGKLLQPDFDNADDKLCLIYSCVNDPRAPPSIDVLYSLKLLDEGLATDGGGRTGRPSIIRSTPFDIIQHRSTLFNAVQHRSRLFNTAQHPPFTNTTAAAATRMTRLYFSVCFFYIFTTTTTITAL